MFPYGVFNRRPQSALGATAIRFATRITASAAPFERSLIHREQLWQRVHGMSDHGSVLHRRARDRIHEIGGTRVPTAPTLGVISHRAYSVFIELLA